MPQITDIKPQKFSRGGPRFNIFVDGKFAFGLPAEALAKAGLQINQEFSKEEIKKLIEENEFSKVFDHALNFLSFRPRSEKELKDWFFRKKVGEKTQKQVFKKLKNLRFLNDEEFAKWWIEQRQTFRPEGFRLLAVELKKKGISREIVEKLLITNPPAGGPITERAQALKIAQKRWERLKGLSYPEAREKLGAFLARRGFSWETIKEVLELIKTVG